MGRNTSRQRASERARTGLMTMKAWMTMTMTMGVPIPAETMEEHAEKDEQFEQAHFDKIMASVKSQENYHSISTTVSLSLADAKITDCINMTDCCRVWHCRKS
jgi:hypothetical protein